MTNAVKTASKRKIRKTAEATGDLIRIKVANKRTFVSKQNLHTMLSRQNKMKQKYQIKDLHLQKKRQQIIGELRLV